MGCSQASTMLACAVSWPTLVGDHLIDRDARLDDRALLNRRAGKQAAGLRGVNALAGGALVEQAVDHVDLAASAAPAAPASC